MAASYLRAHGHVIEAMNWSGENYEIDIIARKGTRIIFVEVKSSSGRSMGPPELRVTKSKQRRITAAASEYLSSMKIPADEVSFDVIAIFWPKDQAPTVEHLESAFNVD